MAQSVIRHTSRYWPANLRRGSQAVRYFVEIHGISDSPATLAKLAPSEAMALRPSVRRTVSRCIRGADLTSLRSARLGPLRTSPATASRRNKTPVTVSQTAPGQSNSSDPPTGPNDHD